MTNCKYLCLVGGFSCSPYFQYRIKQAFGKKLQIIIPAKPLLSVVEGGVYLGLQDPDDLKRAEEMELKEKEIKQNRDNEIAQWTREKIKRNQITTKIFEDAKKEAKQQFDSTINLLGKEYKESQVQMDNIIKERRNKDRSAMTQYKKDLTRADKKYQDTNAKNILKDEKNAIMNEYKENMKSIEIRYNNCI
eukprot:504301_1